MNKSTHEARKRAAEISRLASQLETEIHGIANETPSLRLQLSGLQSMAQKIWAAASEIVSPGPCESDEQLLAHMENSSLLQLERALETGDMAAAFVAFERAVRIATKPGANPEYREIVDILSAARLDVVRWQREQKCRGKIVPLNAARRVRGSR